MKFFAALKAKFTPATAAKTLDAAKATFAEALAALDKIDTMFTNAALDFDELMAKGENGLRDFIAELTNKVTAAEAKVTESAGKVTTAEAATLEATNKISGFNSQIAAFGVLFASIGYKPAEVKGKDGATPTAEEQATAFKTSFDTHVSGAVQQRCQELGIPAAKLPTANPGGDAATTLEEIQAKLATCTDPREAGRLAAAANKLRDAKWVGGKN